MPGRAGPLAERARRAVRRPPHALRHTAVVLSALVVVAISAPALWGGSPERALPPPTVEATAPTNDSGTATVSAGPPPSSTDGAKRSPSVPAGPGTVPTPMTGPDPTRKADPTRPRPAPPADPVEVLSRAQRAVGQGVAAGEIRSDVGVDLDNVLGNLRRDLRQDHSVDLRARLAEIHNKIDTRLGEDALTPSRAERLHAILNEIRD